MANPGKMTIFVINLFVMTNFGTFLKAQRAQNNLLVREIAVKSGLDASLISRYEGGDRLPPEKQLPALANAYNVSITELRVEWLASKVVSLVGAYPDSHKVLTLAESRIAYLTAGNSTDTVQTDPERQALINRVDALKHQWQSCHPLNVSQLERMQAWFRTLYTYESNRIEGNTLTLQETEMVVNQGLTIGGKTMREHLEAINHAEAVDYILALVKGKEAFSPRILRELHGLILRGIDPDQAGRYRSVPVRISGSRHEPPQPWALEGLMEDYFAFCYRQQGQMHPVLFAAEMHERLVTIHPFIDGNGRTSRLVMNLLLLQNGYTIVNLKGDAPSRMAYFQALEAVQMDNRPEVFQQLILEHAIASLEEHLALT